jgi:DNA-nicking Smr family endonuclease
VRSLNPDEAEAWARVAATIRPLSRERVDEPAKALTAELSVEGKPTAPVRTPVVLTQKPKPPVRPEPGQTLDGTWDRRLRSGAVQPDRVLDLHGMTLDSAWTAIDRALEQAVGRGDRLLLLITGHHRPGTAPVQRGKIRAAVHDWLAASRHAARIAAVRGAHPRHGGGGSLYIVLRRR